MKIIFLDIDGVLNMDSLESDEYGQVFHQPSTDNLKYIIDNSNAKIVLSSSWRKSSLKFIQELWLGRKLPGEIIDVTPSLYLKKDGCIVFYNDKLIRHPTERVYGYSIPRGCEIEYWLHNESFKFGNIENYVIIDDNTDMLLNQKDKFIQCSGNIDHLDSLNIGYGLTKTCAETAITILNNKL